MVDSDWGDVWFALGLLFGSILFVFALMFVIAYPIAYWGCSTYSSSKNAEFKINALTCYLSYSGY